MTKKTSTENLTVANPKAPASKIKTTSRSIRPATKLEQDFESGRSGDELERGKHRRAKGKKSVKEDGGGHTEVNRLMRLVSSGAENLTSDELSKLEEQKRKLRYLLGKGKERGYVTYYRP